MIKPEELESCKKQLQQLKPKSIIDQDSLVCLLTLFFVPEKHVNRTVFNSILQNLLFTTETKAWLAKSLIEILQLTNTQNFDNNSNPSSRKSSNDNCLINNPPKKLKNSDSPITERLNKMVTPKLSSIQPNWLNFQVDMSLGHRANVFFFYKPENENVEDFISSKYVKNGTEHKVRLVVNPQACGFVDKNVLDTISEVNPHIIDTLFWLKDDINKITKSQANLFQRLLQLDEGTINEKILKKSAATPTQRKIELKPLNSTPIQKSEKSTSIQRDFSLTPFKTTKELSQTLLSDLISMIDHNMIQSQINLMDKFLEVLVKTCKKLPYSSKTEENESDKEIDATLQKAIKFVVTSLTSSNTSEISVKKLTVVLVSLAKYSTSVAFWIEQELTSQVRNLGMVLFKQLNQLLKEVSEHNLKLGNKRQRYDSENGSYSVSSSRETDQLSRAMESIDKQKRSKENKTIKYELQLPSMRKFKKNEFKHPLNPLNAS